MAVGRASFGATMMVPDVRGETFAASGNTNVQPGKNENRFERATNLERFRRVRARVSS
jgi:hypothetical protein